MFLFVGQNVGIDFWASITRWIRKPICPWQIPSSWCSYIITISNFQFSNTSLLDLTNVLRIQALQENFFLLVFLIYLEYVKIEFVLSRIRT